MGKEGTGGGKAGNLYLRVKIRKSLMDKLKALLSNLKKGFEKSGIVIQVNQ